MATAHTTAIDPRVGCSTISFRHRGLDEALDCIASLGFAEIDLGALPGICDHVPAALDTPTAVRIAASVQASGLRVRSVNGDVGALNAVLDDRGRDARARHVDALLDLCDRTGSSALVLPCGDLDAAPHVDLASDLDTVAASLASAEARAATAGIAVWTESLHLFRLCNDIHRAQALTDRLDDRIGVVMDFSHIVASGATPRDFVARFADRITHVHIRDAVAGDINRSVGNGSADFDGGIAALTEAGYRGHFSLELETHDVAENDRPAAALAAGDRITTILRRSTP